MAREKFGNHREKDLGCMGGMLVNQKNIDLAGWFNLETLCVLVCNPILIYFIANQVHLFMLVFVWKR